MRTVALALVAISRVAGAKPCASATYIEQIEHRADDTVICSNQDERQCWRIDKRGQIGALADWPAAPATTSPYAPGDLVLPEGKSADLLRLRAPDGVDVSIAGAKVEVCVDKKCRSLTVALRSKVDEITEVAVLADKHTVFVGTGLAVIANERLLRFDLDHPDAGRPIGKCATVWDAYPGGNVLVQKTDCANAGGPRLLFSSTGRLLAEVGPAFSMAKGEYHLGGDLWLFVDYGTFAVWDVRRAVVVSRLGACAP